MDQHWLEMKIENQNRELNTLEANRQYALNELINRDTKIADLEFRLSCSNLIIEESLIHLKNSSNKSSEVIDSYINRSKALIASCNVNGDVIKIVNK